MARLRDQSDDNVQDQNSPRIEPAEPPLRRVRSEDILRGDDEVLIDHHGAIYRLRKTSTGKLILQK